MYQESTSIGTEYQLGDRLSLGVHHVHSNLKAFMNSPG
jgi:hypothetical protein